MEDAAEMTTTSKQKLNVDVFAMALVKDGYI